jgi:hypothetical protein
MIIRVFRPVLSTALLALAMPWCAAHAQPRHMEAAGNSLAVHSPCAATVTIQPDPALTGRVVLDATAQHPEETAQLAFDSGDTARLHGPARQCWEPEGETDFQSTLAIAIRVPPAMAIAIEEGGGAEYTLGALHGALTLDISGGVKLQAEQSGALTLALSGGGATKFGQVDGSAKLDVSGGGSVHIDHAVLQDLTISMSGGGDFRLGDGSAARVTVDLSGAASVQIGGVVGDATVELSGVGAVHFAKVTGHLIKDVEGIGTVSVDQPGQP